MKNPAARSDGTPQLGHSPTDDQSGTEGTALGRTVAALLETWPRLTESQTLELRTALRPSGVSNR